MKIESKMLATLMLASLLISATPMIWAVSMSINLSKSNGPVGTELVVSGKIVTYNGDFVIVMDIDNDDAAPVVSGLFTIDPDDKILADGEASGYDVSETVEIPSAWGGSGLKIWLVDTTTAGGAQSAVDFFTVLTTYEVEVQWANVYEGGGFGGDPDYAQKITWTIEGGRDIWNNTLGADAIIRVDDPDGEEQFTKSQSLYLNATSFGAFTGVYIIVGPDNDGMVMDGVWKAYLDIDDSENKANASWNVRVTNAAYERTMNIYANYYDNAGKGLNSIKLFAPNGDEITPLPAYPTALTGGFTTIFKVDHPAKDAALGTYSLKFYGDDDKLVKTVTYVLSKANIVIEWDSFTQTSHFEGTDPVGDVPRMTTVNADAILTYPDGTPCNSIDLESGFTYKTYLNGTAIYTAVSDPITDFTPPSVWGLSWKVPKDAVKGKNYSLNITAASLADIYGNSGPEENFSSPLFKVTNGVLYVEDGPTLTSPASGGNVQRTLTAQARVDIRYADDSKYTGADWAVFNATVQVDDDLNAVAADYNTAAGLWILKYVVPYDADLMANNTFTVDVNDVVDKYGNKGPTADETSGLPGFTIIPAKITVSDLTTSKTEYNTDDQVTVTFKAKYPSLAPVTEAGEDYHKVTFLDLEDNMKATKEATYNAATQTWQASFLIPADFMNGVYTVQILKDNVRDADDVDDPNKGPSATLETTYAVSRISLTDVYRLITTVQGQQVLDGAKADAAKVAADAASAAAAAGGVKADAAAAAATAAGTKADAAKTAADAASAAATAAGTKADGAKTAADAAKASADAAKAAADAAGTKTDSIVGKIDGLQTLVYGAIGASLIAAIAAIVALMQISRKIA